MVDFVSVVYRNLGHSDYHSNKAIAAVHQLSPDSIKQQLTSSQQYRLLEIKHGVGYKITDQFKKIFISVGDSEKRGAVIASWSLGLVGIAEISTPLVVRFARYYRCSNLPGNRMTPFSKPKKPSTAIPRILNGIVSIQKIGYSTKAKIASGQQRIKRMIQAMNVIIG